MGTKLSQKELEIYEHVDDVLFYEWDPIGISDDPSSPRNEYSSYLPTIYSKLSQTIDPKELSDYLIEIEKDRMGFEPTSESIQKSMRIANALISYYRLKIDEDPGTGVQYGRRLEEYERIVATGTWLYDKTIPMKIKIYSSPAKYSCTRYNDEEELDESLSIPVTPDGLIYKIFPGWGEEHTLEKAKAWADGQPWGPCVWDKVITISKI